MNLKKLIKKILQKLRGRKVDKKNNKPDLLTSGSLGVVEAVESSTKELEDATKDMAKNAEESIEDRLKSLSSYDEDQVADIMDQILGLAGVEKDLEMLSVKPGCMLNGNANPVWLYSATRRAFFAIANGSEILSIEKIDENKSQCLINNDIYEVHNDMIKFIGWN
jgi:hypothetical protein